MPARAPQEPYPPSRQRAERARRGVHVGLSLSLLYYAVPDPLPMLGLPKAQAALGLALLTFWASALQV